MKITKFLGLSFLLFAFAATSFPEGVHAKDPAAVLDFNGHEVQAGASYLIDEEDILVVNATINPICNSDVILSTGTEGLPVRFSPVINSTDGVIREGTLITVSFHANTCNTTAGVTPMISSSSNWRSQVMNYNNGMSNSWSREDHAEFLRRIAGLLSCEEPVKGVFSLQCLSAREEGVKFYSANKCQLFSRSHPDFM